MKNNLITLFATAVLFCLITLVLPVRSHAEEVTREVNVYQASYRHQSDCERDWGNRLQYLCVSSGWGYLGPKFFFANTKDGSVAVTTNGSVQAIPGNTLGLPSDHHPVGSGFAIGTRFFVEQPVEEVKDADGLKAQSEDHPVLVAQAGGVRIWRIRDHTSGGQGLAYLITPTEDGKRVYPEGKNAPILLGTADGVSEYKVYDKEAFRYLYFTTLGHTTSIVSCGRYCSRLIIDQGVRD